MADWTRQKPNDANFWQKCLDHEVEPFGEDHAYKVVVVLSKSVKLIGRSSGVAPEISRFVLISDQLPSATIQRLTTVLRNNRLSSGYLVREALDYQTIFMIDPNQDFTASDRTLFVENDRTLIKINGNTGAELAQDLESKLS